ncbi:MAG TPA: hypothetical protein VMB52_06385 [Verrucomicrobiae bacterium]|nr:hypothetical protein [Verrucomicrobiae bacterium]
MDLDQQEQQLVERVKQAQNVLVTVSTNPSVDQLAAAIGLTLALNKLDKHGTAVFSGQVPSTIEFLKPENTLEKNTDSLRDFIIALDKSKADKLRYKVEDQVVRIFITPYRTSLSEKDLEFSQGDFNVDVVVALGVANQQELDAAITAHGRILHDATVTTVSTGGQSELGTINWVDPSASSLSEMMLYLIDGLDKNLLDNQIATALLTGIVASTDRFRNEKTTPQAMNVSAELMAAGANPQLIATELEAAPLIPTKPQPIEEVREAAAAVPPEQAAEPGELDIDHDADDKAAAQKKPEPQPQPKEQVSPAEFRAPAPEPDLGVEKPMPELPEPEIHVDEDGVLSPATTLPPLPPQMPLPQISQVHGVEGEGLIDESNNLAPERKRMAAAPGLGGANLTANVMPEEPEPPTEELTLPPVNAAAPLLTHNESVLPPVPVSPTEQNGNPYFPQAPLGLPQDWQPPAAPVAPSPMPAYTVPLPSVSSLSAAAPVAPFSPPPLAPSLPNPIPAAPPISPAAASLIPGETLEEIEEAVRSPHLQQPAHKDSSPGFDAGDNVEAARNAVQAAFSNGPDNEPPRPMAALGAQPLGPDIHAHNPGAPTGGISASGGQPPNAMAPNPMVDLPSPSNPFGPSQSAMPPIPPQQNDGGVQGSAPPVPPPFVPPRQ